MEKRGLAPALYAGFAATGVGCALPGVLLPLLEGAWHWNDRQAGRLFFVLAAASATGPLALRGKMRWSVGIGFGLLALGALGLSMHARLAYASGAAWGLGLGMAMTGISLLSEALPGLRQVVLLRLNFVWAAGAVACPALLAVAFRMGSAQGILVGVSVVGAGFALWFAARALSVGGQDSRSETTPVTLTLRGVPFGLVLATALAPGIEASGGAWLATYADRTVHLNAVTVGAPACFWAGLLLSRALGWLPGAKPGGTKHLRGLMTAVALAMGCLLLPAMGTAALLGVSGLLGFGLGPLYPEFLARALGYRQTSLIFVIAGGASSVMPWATGLVSSAAGSLRVGLCVPALGACVLLAAGWSAAGRERHGAERRANLEGVADGI